MFAYVICAAGELLLL